MKTFFKWIIAIVMLFVISYVLILFNYPFEWLVSHTVKWNKFVYFILWFTVFLPLMAVIVQLIFWYLFLISFSLTEKSKIFSTISIWVFSIQIILTLLFLWVGVIQFSWEIYRYSLFNKVIYSLILLWSLTTPHFAKGMGTEDDKESQLTTAKKKPISMFRKRAILMEELPKVKARILKEHPNFDFDKFNQRKKDQSGEEEKRNEDE